MERQDNVEVIKNTQPVSNKTSDNWIAVLLFFDVAKLHDCREQKGTAGAVDYKTWGEEEEEGVNEICVAN